MDQRTQDAFLEYQRLMCGGTVTAARIALHRTETVANLAPALIVATIGGVLAAFLAATALGAALGARSTGDVDRQLGLALVGGLTQPDMGVVWRAVPAGRLRRKTGQIEV